ncbi:MAG TPA: hypothetical protein VGM90_25525 [Kofleriaceae bacterium]|jgi:hypothetical protein
MRSFWASLVLATVAATATAALIGLTGCTLYFDHKGDDTTGDDQPPPCGGVTTTPLIRLVNPETLACQDFSGGDPCAGSCGPCSGATSAIPPWGSCLSECIGMSESACASDPACYVAKESNKYYGNGGVDPQHRVDDFLGCYPVSTGGVADTVSCNFLDALSCTSDNGCTAIYDAPYGTGCGGLKTVTPEQCPGAEFVACVNEGVQDPGVCTNGTVSCNSSPPLCPQNQSPGIVNGCWSGACIPQQYCGLL